VSFEVGDGRDLRVEPASFDVVVLHTVLCHVPEPETVLAEAARALRVGVAVAVFDGDYAMITFAVADGDPLEVCADEFRRAYVHDPWIMRRMPAMVRAAGFADPRLQSHGYVQTEDVDYMFTVVHRGADALAARGVTSAEHVESLKREARRRVAEGSFFGHNGYISVVATKAA
jgi:arsenite methyltransferase